MRQGEVDVTAALGALPWRAAVKHVVDLLRAAADPAIPFMLDVSREVIVDAAGPHQVQPGGDVARQDTDALVEVAGVLRRLGEEVQRFADPGRDCLLEAIDVHLLRQSGGHGIQVADRAGNGGGERGTPAR